MGSQWNLYRFMLMVAKTKKMGVKNTENAHLTFIPMNLLAFLTNGNATVCQVRRLKSAASVIGLSVGCLIGMLPLLFMTDRKAMYFDDKELSLYETCFQPFGVEPKVSDAL